MIGKISGRLDFRAPDHVMIDTGGVGYIVFCSERTLASMPQTGSPVALYTDMVVREDLLQLYGFTSLEEREWHRLLTSVQGVGAKAALAIQGTLGADGVSRAIALGDVASVKAAPGVGPKLAQRVVNELKDKAPAVMAMGTGPAATVSGAVIEPADVSPADARPAPGGGAQADALSALGNLGYAPGEAAAAVAQVAGEHEGADAPELIRLALQKLAPKG